MKKINFDFKILDLSGKEIEGFLTKEVIANIIASGNSQFPVRMYEIARKIYSEGEVELPSEDVLKIKNAIEKNNTLTDLTRAQILEILE